MYARHLLHLDQWLSLFNLSVAGLAETPHLLDDKIVDYLEHLFANNRPKGWAGSTLAAVQHQYPRLKGELKASWRASFSWNNLSPSEFRTPWPVLLLRAFVSLGLLTGRPDISFAFWVGFHCLLRPGEISAVVRDTLRVPTDFMFQERRLGIFIVVDPKTRRRFAKSQHVLIDGQLLLDCLECFLIDLQPSARVFPTYLQLQKVLSLWIAALELPKGLFTLGGLRAGGATHHYLEQQNVGVLQRRGRWVSSSSLEHYIQEATVVLATSFWSQHSHFKLQKLASLTPALIRSYVRKQQEQQPG